MVVPSCLADTVTPPSFSPDGEEIAPDSTTSAAEAPVAANPVTTRLAALASRILRKFVMEFLPLRVLRSARVQERWWLFDWQNDRVDQARANSGSKAGIRTGGAAPDRAPLQPAAIA